MLPLLAIAGALMLGSTRARAGDSVVVTIVDGRKAKADITLAKPGGGDYTAEFEIEFEAQGLENLTPECIGISADVLDAGEIADVEGRLPHDWQTVDPAFPVRVTVEPPAGCGLSFENHYDVSLDTGDLVYAPFSVYRLVKAPIGGPFRYVTSAVTSGSVRSRGSSGGFSEFVMIKDASPSYAVDCRTEYSDIATRLRTAEISPAVRRVLETDLAISRAAYEAGNYADAIARLAIFDAHSLASAGPALPNRWRSARDLDNVEGDLVGNTDNLRFMMGRLSGSP
ncbi:MAG TPA: DUF6689 family protein [Rhodanobacteraceae bacterium]|nr:DUF6689 family protein [Rhodanobacteraceae bacterium]